MSSKSAEGQQKGILCFLFKFVKKWAPNRPKADKKGFYVFLFNFGENEAQIGWRPIKGDILFIF